MHQIYFHVLWKMPVNFLVGMLLLAAVPTLDLATAAAHTHDPPPPPLLFGASAASVAKFLSGA